MSLNRDSCLSGTEEGCEADLPDRASAFWLKAMGQEEQSDSQATSESSNHRGKPTAIRAFTV